MTLQEKTNFIKQIAGHVLKYAPKYGILCNSAVIAQAILESGWGESKLAAKYHNYFGLKCGTLWKGKSVNMKTQEEYTPGTKTTISDNFRVYDNMEEGVKGYFEFIQLSRYQNLRGIKDPKEYLETIRADGYATSSSYVRDVLAVVNQFGLTEYDGKVIIEVETAPDLPAADNLKSTPKGVTADDLKSTPKGVTADDPIRVMKGWLGLSRSAGTHKTIIDLYNSHKPLARGYKVGYSDAYCDTTVSAVFIKLGAVDLIGGTECGVEEHVKLFKKAGIWIEDGTIIPKKGDIIVYNWDQNSQPNDGYADHIGFVEFVSGLEIHTIEGNTNSGKVDRKIYTVGSGYIRGYARPKYSESSDGVKKKEPVTSPVPENKSETQTTSNGELSKDPKWVGAVTATSLNVRTWAGMQYPNIKTYPILSLGNLIDVCDEAKDDNGKTWYYVRIAGKFYGFVHSDYITMASQK